MDRSGRAKASVFRTPSGASELCGEHFQGGWMLGCKHASMLCYGRPESSWLECSGSDLAGEMVLKAILFAKVLATLLHLTGSLKQGEGKGMPMSEAYCDKNP